MSKLIYFTRTDIYCCEVSDEDFVEMQTLGEGEFLDNMIDEGKAVWKNGGTDYEIIREVVS